MEQQDAEALATEVERLFAELAPRLPDVDPDDLVLILQSVLRPLGTGRRFILRRVGGALVV
jgi:hypothetical protein